MDVASKSTGNSYVATELNQQVDELENIISDTGQTPSAGDLDQVGKGIVNYVAHGDFYTDSGIADAYVLSALGSKQSPTVYADGFKARFIVDNTNTGASTVNVATLGVKDIVKNGVALSGGELAVGDEVTLRYDDGNSRFELSGVVSASVTVPGIVELATDAEVKTGTDTARVPSVASLNAHEGIAKAWLNFTDSGTAAINDGFNVTSVTDTGTGDYTVNFTTAFANNDYALGVWAQSGTTSAVMVYADTGDTMTTTAKQIRVKNFNNTAVDPEFCTAIFTGDQ